MSPSTVRTNGHGAASGSLGSSRIAPSSRSRSRRTPGRDVARRRRPAATAIAAAVPAAWPMAMHWAIERTEACASWVAEKQRPATSTLAASRDEQRAVRDAHAPRRRAGTASACRRRHGGPRWARRRARPASSNCRARQHVLARQPVVAVDPPRLADADLRHERDERGVARSPGTRSTRKRAYSSACRRPPISASVRNQGSVALTTAPSGRAGPIRAGS